MTTPCCRFGGGSAFRTETRRHHRYDRTGAGRLGEYLSVEALQWPHRDAATRHVPGDVSDDVTCRGNTRVEARVQLQLLLALESFALCCVCRVPVCTDTGQLAQKVENRPKSSVCPPNGKPKMRPRVFPEPGPQEPDLMLSCVCRCLGLNATFRTARIRSTRNTCWTSRNRIRTWTIFCSAARTLRSVAD